MSRSRATCSRCTAAVARTAERTVTLILDPGDDLADLEELRRLHSRPYGQILCEPDPTATPTGLASHLLIALGKDPDRRGNASPWPLLECQLKAERVRDLVLARAQTLSYGSLRRLADHAYNAGISLWLWSATERPTAALAQLLEARPHDHATVSQLLDRWRRPPPQPDPGLPDIPPGAGPSYPWLTPCTDEDLRSRTALAAGVKAADRRRVATTWTDASDWADSWLTDNDGASLQEIADAFHALVAAGDTASEHLTRTRAAITQAHRHGIPVNRALLHRDHTLAYGESRPHQWRDTVSRIAELADHAADPHDAALIVLGTLFRDPYATIRIRILDVSPDGAITRAPWSRPHAVPPELRGPLATQHDYLHRGATPRPADSFLPGTTRGRMNQRSVEHAMNRLEVPESIWQSSGSDDDFGEGPRLDGRTILGRLNPITLFTDTSDTPK